MKKWTKQQIKICPVEGDPVTVEAHCSGGLAIHQQYKGKGWVISHQASGKLCSYKTTPTLKAAKAIVDKLVLLPIDWTIAPDEIPRQMRTNGSWAKMFAIIGA